MIYVYRHFASEAFSSSFNKNMIKPIGAGSPDIMGHFKLTQLLYNQ